MKSHLYEYLRQDDPDEEGSHFGSKAKPLQILPAGDHHQPRMTGFEGRGPPRQELAISEVWPGLHCN